MHILKSSIRAIVRPFFALLSIISSCVQPQGLTDSAVGGLLTATPHNEWSSLQCYGAPAVLYHDPQAWIAQSKSHDRIALEWIADSGAGHDLASNRAFIEQGVPGTVVQSCTQSISPIKFETGNGSYTADACVSLNGSTFGHANFSVMKDCPIVRSLGKIVSTGKPFVWLPDQLPFFCQDVEGIQLTYVSTKVHSASRVEDNVPIFSETFQMNDTFALPAEEVLLQLKLLRLRLRQVMITWVRMPVVNMLMKILCPVLKGFKPKLGLFNTKCAIFPRTCTVPHSVDQ